MAFEQRDGSGALFKSDQKGNDKAPGYRGDITINGVKYELAAWVKEGAKGKFFSLTAKPKEERPSQAAQQSRAAVNSIPHDDFEDPEIPF